MRQDYSNDVAKLRMMAAQMRHNAQMARDPGYRAKFERAAAELDVKAQEAEQSRVRRLFS